jgi:hypothetical protein
MSSYANGRFAVLPNSISSQSNMEDAIDLAKTRNTGWVFVTDDVMDNPFDTLPSYWEEQVAYIADLNNPPAMSLPNMATLDTNEDDTTNNFVGLVVTLALLILIGVAMVWRRLRES